MLPSSTPASLGILRKLVAKATTQMKRWSLRSTAQLSVKLFGMLVSLVSESPQR